MRADYTSGVWSGVHGTPTFFINGRRFDGDWRNPAAFVWALGQAARSTDSREATGGLV